jgi:hypothetical protein
MDFTTTLTTTEDKVTWGMDADYITDLSYDPANRTIIVQFNGNSIKCRIGGYERDLAAALWKQLAKAHKAKDLVYLCAKGTWSPNQWFCGMQNHTEDYLDAEECAYWMYNPKEVDVNRLLP